MPKEVLFSKKDLSAYFDAIQREAKRRVSDTQVDLIKVPDSTDLVERLLSDLAPHAPLLRCDQQYVLEPEEVEIRLEDYGQSIRTLGTRITIVVPFDGERDLFMCRPSSSTSILPRAVLGVGDLQLAYDFLPGRSGEPRKEVDGELELIESYLRWVRADVESFIPDLRRTILKAVDDRRCRLTSATAAIAALGLPVKPRSADRLALEVASDMGSPIRHDAFLSYASEDHEFAKALHTALTKAGYDVWFAPLNLTVGDSLNQEINRGLSEPRYGIVVLSLAFFSKYWPQYELGGLLAREAEGRKVVLPVWRNITKEQILAHQPALADKFALASPPMDLPTLVAELGRVLRRS